VLGWLLAACSITILGTGQLFSTGGTVGMINSVQVGSQYVDAGALSKGLH
jgi:hypothetical protein